GGFLRLWTLKEATVKALGSGIAGSLQGFAFAACDPPTFVVLDPALGEPERWFFWRQDWAGFSVALALRLGLAQKIDIDFQIAEPPP
ncbi:MAG TPA: 4'-phosphopantetheinyl transferase superfamily protein, partial [Azospirillaceae bacterium]|nr:4'-phosphopantetheinyl transferase superfamily protein [Azospirillaceae bacterium]